MIFVPHRCVGVSRHGDRVIGPWVEESLTQSDDDDDDGDDDMASGMLLTVAQMKRRSCGFSHEVVITVTHVSPISAEAGLLFLGAGPQSC